MGRRGLGQVITFGGLGQIHFWVREYTMLYLHHDMIRNQHNCQILINIKRMKITKRNFETVQLKYEEDQGSLAIRVLECRVTLCLHFITIMQYTTIMQGTTIMQDTTIVQDTTIITVMQYTTIVQYTTIMQGTTIVQYTTIV